MRYIGSLIPPMESDWTIVRTLSSLDDQEAPVSFPISGPRFSSIVRDGVFMLPVRLRGGELWEHKNIGITVIGNSRASELESFS